MIPYKKIAANLRTTITRFPEPILSAVLAFLFLIISVHYVKDNSILKREFIFAKLTLEGISGISLFFSFNLFAFAKKISTPTRLGFILLGFSVLGLHFYSITPGMFDAESIFISRYLIFVVCFHLLVSFVPFSNAAQVGIFWRYNFYLLRNFLQSILFSISLFIGFSSALWAIGHLFGFHFSENYYVDIAAFIFLVFNTIYFAMSIPENFAYFKEEKPFHQGIRIFVQYILLPIIAIYMFILYAYMFKMLLTHHIPNGWVCIPILIFAGIGTLAYLLIYPIRNDPQHRMVFLFSKYFFYILLPLLSLLFIAIIKRILPYGVTEDRYLVIVLGLWLLIMSVYIILSKRDNIIVAPISLFLLLAVSAIGPWGMFQLSVQNQFSRLERSLKRNHLLVNNKLQALHAKQKISSNEAASIRSILWYLNKRGEIGRIHSWLNEKDQLKLKKAIEGNDMHLIHVLFGSGISEGNSSDDYQYYLQADRRMLVNRPLAISGFQHLVEFETISSVDYDSYLKLDSNQVVCVTDRQRLYFIHHQDTILECSIKSRIEQLLHQQWLKDSIELKSAALQSSIQLMNQGIRVIDFPADSMRQVEKNYRLYFQSVELRQQDSIYLIDRMNGWLLY